MILEQLPIANRVLGTDHRITISLQRNVVIGLLEDDNSTREDALQAERMANDTLSRLRRVYGAQHPDTITMEAWSRRVHKKLEQFEP